MKNREIAGIFNSIADALEIKGEIDFKVLAYRKAARTIEGLTEDIDKLARENKLDSIPGIGQGMREKITEYLKTGKMSKQAEALSGIPETLLELLGIQGLGGKTIHVINKELGVKSIEDLKKVVDDGSLAGLRGFGDKKAANIKKAIETRESYTARISIYEASIIADALVDFVKSLPSVSRVSVAGSLRRMKETVGDIDILCSSSKGPEVVQAFTRHPGAIQVLAEGETKGSILAKIESAQRQVDLRVVSEEEYGAALLYFTGSKEHNVKLRSLAKDRGLKISEYGVFRGNKRIAGRSEQDCYRALDMPWIPVEMREDRGEIELALSGKLPVLVELEDIKGDLHVHSRASDGTMSLEEIIEAGRQAAYSYIAICDHSVSAGYAHGLDAKRLAAQGAEIDSLNRSQKKFRLLKGTEVDILPDGKLDFPDEVLAGLDFVVAAIHSAFRKNVTARISAACRNPYIRTIAHPTGRLISGRSGYEVDVEAIIEAAAATGTALELNSYYDRLDLNELNLKKAKERGVKITIGTDTHYPGGLGMIRFGLGIARRAWLEKGDIVNCLAAEKIQASKKNLPKK